MARVQCESLPFACDPRLLEAHACILLASEHFGNISNNQTDYQNEYVVYLKYSSIILGRSLQEKGWSSQLFQYIKIVKACQKWIFKELYHDCGLVMSHDSSLLDALWLI